MRFRHDSCLTAAHRSSSKFYATVRQLTARLQTKLKSQIDVLDPAQYMAAKNYLLSLNDEAQRPVVVRALAAR